MRFLPAIPMGLLLLGLATSSASVAQEVQADSNRKIVSSLPPKYPDLARTMHLEGTVKLRITVAPNGSVKAVETLGGSPILTRAAEEAIYKWRWNPVKEESKELVEIKFHR